MTTNFVGAGARFYSNFIWGPGNVGLVPQSPQSFTLPLPASIVAGDLLVAVLRWYSNNGTAHNPITGMSGWTLITGNGSGTTGINMYRKTAVLGETSPIMVITTDPAEDINAVIVSAIVGAWRGPSNTLTGNGSSVGVSNTGETCPGYTATNSHSLVVYGSTNENDTGTTWSVGTEWADGPNGGEFSPMSAWTEVLTTTIPSSFADHGGNNGAWVGMTASFVATDRGNWMVG